jgi:hypothetical protein
MISAAALCRILIPSSRGITEIDRYCVASFERPGIPVAAIKMWSIILNVNFPQKPMLKQSCHPGIPFVSALILAGILIAGCATHDPQSAGPISQNQRSLCRDHLLGHSSSILPTKSHQNRPKPLSFSPTIYGENAA